MDWYQKLVRRLREIILERLRELEIKEESVDLTKEQERKLNIESNTLNDFLTNDSINNPEGAKPFKTLESMIKTTDNQKLRQKIELYDGVTFTRRTDLEGISKSARLESGKNFIEVGIEDDEVLHEAYRAGDDVGCFDHVLGYDERVYGNENGIPEIRRVRNSEKDSSFNTKLKDGTNIDEYEGPAVSYSGEVIGRYYESQEMSKNHQSERTITTIGNKTFETEKKRLADGTVFAITKENGQIIQSVSVAADGVVRGGVYNRAEGEMMSIEYGSDIQGCEVLFSNGNIMFRDERGNTIDWELTAEAYAKMEDPYYHFEYGFSDEMAEFGPRNTWLYKIDAREQLGKRVVNKDILPEKSVGVER